MGESDLLRSENSQPEPEQAAPVASKPKARAFKQMSQGYTFKVLLLVVLILLLLIPLAMLRSLVYERGRTAKDAETDIMAAWGNQLVEAGPVIAIPGERTQEIRTRTEKNGVWTEEVGIEIKSFTLVLTPKQLDMLIGSVGAFVVTALVMFLTRNLDWHGQGDQ